MKTHRMALANALDPITLFQAILFQMLLLLSFGLFTRGEWGPALVVLTVYVLTFVINNAADRRSTRTVTGNLPARH